MVRSAPSSRQPLPGTWTSEQRQKTSSSQAADPTMSLGAPSQFLVDLRSFGGGVESPKAGGGLEVPNEEATGCESQAVDGTPCSLPVCQGPSKSPPANACTAQRCFWFLGTFGVLIAVSLAVWCGVKHLRKPLPLWESLPLQDAEAILTRCSGEDQGAPVGNGKKVSFKIRRNNFLLEAHMEGRPRWLPVCHENWDAALGTWICRQLGHVRLTHHKGVNLTDVTLNGTQEFAQVLPDWKGAVEPTWQIRKRCPLGRIVALKCLECGACAKAPPAMEGPGPWQVSLSLDARQMCTGSLLSQEWVVTAARCAQRSLQLPRWVAFGGLEVQTWVKEQDFGQGAAGVEKVVPHPDYDGRSCDSDIAMLKLKEPLNFSDAVQAICLPRYHQDVSRPNRCWISAQAHSSKEPVTLISTQMCNSSCRYAGEFTPRTLCARYLDGSIKACQGENSEPLVCQQEDAWRLAGIGCRCAEPGGAGIYTKVAEHLDWIYEVMEESNQ